MKKYLSLVEFLAAAVICTAIPLRASITFPVPDTLTPLTVPTAVLGTYDPRFPSLSLSVTFTQPDACDQAGISTGGSFIGQITFTGQNGGDFSASVQCFKFASGVQMGNLNIFFHPSSFGFRSAIMNVVLVGAGNVTTSVKGYRLSGYVTTSTPGYSTFAHIASGLGWETQIVLSNLSNSLILRGHLSFFDGAGRPLSLKYSLLQAGTTTAIASSVDLNIQMNAQFIVSIADPDISSILTGWAFVQVSDPSAIGFPPQGLDGFAVFKQSIPGDPDLESLVPLNRESYTPITLAFDNTGGFRTGVAIVNADPLPVFIWAAAVDDQGYLLMPSTRTLQLSGHGHESIFIDELFPVLANHRGMINFSADPYGRNIDAVGLRFNPTGSFTSIPIIRPSAPQ